MAKEKQRERKEKKTNARRRYREGKELRSRLKEKIL
jgi:hypothetical protein